MTALPQLVDRLCAASRREFYSPFEGLVWPDELPEEAWHFTPELVSLYGSEAWEGATERQRRRLAFYEAVSFFSLNIHGEKSLMEGLAHRLYRKQDEALTPYLHHFLDEENKHSIYFGTFCLRYAGKVYPDKKMVFPREYAPGEEDLLFFAKVLVFEEIVDVYNKRMAADGRLHPLAREINRLHHRDESRHLAFGRRVVADLFERHAPGWSAEVVAGLREYLSGYIVSTWREYYNPAVYRDAGLPDAYALQQAVFDSPGARRHREEVTRPCLKVLRRAQVLAEAPPL